MIGVVAKIDSPNVFNFPHISLQSFVDFIAQKRRNQVRAIPKIIRISQEKLMSAISALILIIHKRSSSCQPHSRGERPIHVTFLKASLYFTSSHDSTIQLAGSVSFKAERKTKEIPTAKATNTGAKRSFKISPMLKKSILSPISPSISQNTSFNTRNGDIAITIQSTITLHSRTTTNAASGKTSKIANQTFRACIKNFWPSP